MSSEYFLINMRDSKTTPGANATTNSELDLATICPELVEQLADYAHEAWSGWMKYLFRLSDMNTDGTITIPVKLVTRWFFQTKTKYKDLSEDMKLSDRKEAEKMIAIMQPAIAADRKRIKELEEKRRYGFCIWCGYAIELASFEKGEALQLMKDHELECPEHPLQSRLERLEKLILSAPIHHFRNCSIWDGGKCNCDVILWAEQRRQALEKEKP